MTDPLQERWNQVCVLCGKPLLLTYDQGRPCWGTHLKHLACLRAEQVAERLLRSVEKDDV